MNKLIDNTNFEESLNHSGAGDEEKIQFRNIAPVLEFICWIILALVPFLRLFNGPAVTDDQFTIQIAVAVLALLGALDLRFYNWRLNRLRK